jgi:hypothetical protein
MEKLRPLGIEIAGHRDPARVSGEMGWQAAQAVGCAPDAAVAVEVEAGGRLLHRLDGPVEPGIFHKGIGRDRGFQNRQVDPVDLARFDPAARPELPWQADHHVVGVAVGRPEGPWKRFITKRPPAAAVEGEALLVEAAPQVEVGAIARKVGPFGESFPQGRVVVRTDPGQRLGVIDLKPRSPRDLLNLL